MALPAIRTITVGYENAPDVSLLPETVQARRKENALSLTWSPGQLEMSELLALLQKAGTIREMTVQPQNIDQLIAAMYREMGL